MRTRLTITALIISISLMGQGRMNEKRTMEEKHIDFSKEVIYFELSGLIEIDGHLFLNDTCACPFVYTANLDGITIMNSCSKCKYEHRTCQKEECTIIHLVPLRSTLTDPSWVYPFHLKPYLENVPEHILNGISVDHLEMIYDTIYSGW